MQRRWHVCSVVHENVDNAEFIDCLSHDRAAVIRILIVLTKAAVAHMKPGGCIVNTTSVDSDMPNSMLPAYATTKGAIQNFTGDLAQMLADKGCHRLQVDRRQFG